MEAIKHGIADIELGVRIHCVTAGHGVRVRGTGHFLAEETPSP